MDSDEDTQAMAVDSMSAPSKNKGKVKDDRPLENDNLPW